MEAHRYSLDTAFHGVRGFSRLLGEIPRPHLFLLLVLMIVSAATDGVGVVLLVPLLSAVETGGAGASVNLKLGQLNLPDGLAPLLLVFFVVVVLRTALVFWLGIYRARLQHGLVDDLRQRCYGALVRSEWRWLTVQRAADHNATLVTNIAMVGASFEVAARSISAILVGVALVVAGLYLSWPATAFAIVLGILALLAQSGIRRRAAYRGKMINEGNRDLHRHVEQGLAQIRLSRVFGRESEQIAGFAAAVENIRDRKLASVRDTSAGQAAMQIGAAALLGVFAYWGLEIEKLTLPVLLPMLVILLRALSLFSTLQQGWTDWLHASPAYAEVSLLIADAELNAEPAAIEGAALDLNVAFEFDAVSFTYPGRTHPVLDHVSLHLPAKKTVALTGESGAGKSTVADLVMGLLAPQEGRILVDGAELKGSQRLRWRQQVAYVEQETILANGSIRENLLWAKPDATDAELEEALALASADFVMTLSHGLDTHIGDNGLRLSGGERQRIAIARALLRQPQLLILDEATSALDRENETVVLEAINRLHGRMTILLIGHRNSMLEQADQLVELRSGRAVKAS